MDHPELDLTSQLLPAHETLERQLVIKLVQQVLGWQPTVLLEQGLEHTIAWFKNLLVKSAQQP